MTYKRKLVVINPNTNSKVTELIDRTVRVALKAGTELVSVNPHAGPRSIELPEHRDEAVSHWLEKLREMDRVGADAYVLACFDEFGLMEARRQVTAPVVGAVEASISFAQIYAERFAIITTVETAVPSILRLVEKYGATRRCIVHATGLGVAQAAQGTDEVLEVLVRTGRELITKHQVGAIVLGSGGLVGQAAELSAQLGVPVIDAIVSGAMLAEAMLQSNNVSAASL